MGAERRLAIPSEWPRRKAMAVLGGLLGGGLLLRLADAAWGYFSTFDTATVGLMALNILKHGERPLFFYGQTYFGALEAYVAAALFAVFGVSEVSLTLSPILFSLGWIAATYLLFSEWAGRRAGLTAAALLAAPSWVLLHYNVGTYGGYPAAFLFGTLALWLGLRIEQRDPTGPRLLIHALPLGAAAGLAIWTHYLSLAYLFPAALLVLAFLVRRRFSWPALWPFLAALAPFGVGVLPVLFASDLLHGTQQVAQFNFSPGSLRAHAAGLLGRPFRQQAFNQWESAAAHAAIVLAVAVSAGLFIIAVIRAPRGARARRLFPLFFAGLFLALYIPHAMADTGAARYTFPLWTILMAGWMAVPLASAEPGLRRVGGLLAGLWVVYYAASDVAAIAHRVPKRKAEMNLRAAVVAAAREANLQTVMVVGSPLDGHSGQVFGFAARGEIAFVSAWDERHQPSAERAERDDRCGLLVRRNGEAHLAAALKDLGASWARRSCEEYILFHDLRAVPRAGRVVERSLVRITGPARDTLSDRCLNTFLAGSCATDGLIQLELVQRRRIHALALVPPSDERGRLPNTFSLSGSADGVHFEKLRPAVERTAVAWTAGNRAWVKGYGGHLECRFPPVDLKTLRLQIPGGRRDDTNTWRIAEIYLFEESSPSAVPEEEPSKVWAKARELGLDFVAADRWLSARLAERRRSDADTPKVYPRYNPKYPATLLDRRLAPRAGLGLAVAKGVADETESLLRATFPHAEWTRHDFDAYALFAFHRAAARSPDEGPVQWSGSFLLKATASGEGPAETK